MDKNNKIEKLNFGIDHFISEVNKIKMIPYSKMPVVLKGKSKEFNKFKFEGLIVKWIIIDNILYYQHKYSNWISLHDLNLNYHPCILTGLIFHYLLDNQNKFEIKSNTDRFFAELFDNVYKLKILKY
jgi:hypothetical protein